MLEHVPQRGYATGSCPQKRKAEVYNPESIKFGWVYNLLGETDVGWSREFYGTVLTAYRKYTPTQSFKYYTHGVVVVRFQGVVTYISARTKTSAVCEHITS